MNYCLAGGYLVGAKEWIPNSPIEYHLGLPGAAVGCNQLQCRDCGKSVRHLQGVQLGERISLEAAALYATPDWFSISGIVQGHATLYACACNFHWEFSRMGMDDPDPAQIERGVVYPNWKCGGHAHFSMPGTLDGNPIEDAEGVSSLAKSILGGKWKESKPNPIRNGYPGYLLWRLYSLVKDGGLGKIITDLMVNALVGADVEERRTAIAFYEVFPLAAGAEKLADIFTSHKALFVGVTDPFLDYTSLDTHFEEALQNRLQHGPDPKALAVVRQYMLNGAPLNKYRFALLQRIDRPWLETNRDAILTGDPKLLGHWIYMVRAFPAAEIFKELSALYRLNLLDRETFINSIQSNLQDFPEKTASLLEQFSTV